MKKDDLVGIIVDAGHGGIDSGAIGNNLQEKDLTLKAALYMYERLNELGFPVKITRTTDEYLPKEERIKRIKGLYDNNPNTILISNHINAGGGEGAEVVYSLKNNPTLANLVLENIGDTGQIKRKAYQRRLPENPNKDYYYILRETGNTEPILVEYGFIDNTKDSNKLKNNLLEYVEAVVKAIAEYTEYPYSPPNEEMAQEKYTVKKGDTLYEIYKTFNIPIEVLKRINRLTSDILVEGQLLNLTDLNNEDNENIYTVKKGDTLYSIARDNNTTIEEIKRLNNLSNETLSINQTLIIKEEDNLSDNEDIPNDDYSTYIVEKGDSLWKISKKYNISVPELIELNNLTDLNLKINQKLLVPNIEPQEENVYIVKKGDTLWSVSKLNNISVNELKELNNLKSNLLSIGQKLIIK